MVVGGDDRETSAYCCRPSSGVADEHQSASTSSQRTGRATHGVGGDGARDSGRGRDPCGISECR